MLQNLIKEANKDFTENGAVTNASALSDCLDFFATVGAIRKEKDEEIEKRFIRAYTENKDTAMKILFFARDIRGGLGERRVFRVILNWLAFYDADSLRKNLEFVAEYGRYDDLLALTDTPCEKDALEIFKRQFNADLKAMAERGKVSLLAKWLPSVNASNKETIAFAKKVANYFGMDYALYRKSLSVLRKYIRIIENNLREKDYTFDYETEPSKALYKYRKAFIRNDGERYKEFINKVEKGEAKLNASTLAPYEVIAPLLKENFNGKKITKEEIASINATWNSLPDFSTDENALAVIDTSGSMYYWDNATPASVAISLGIYFAERNKGAFKDYFIEFSAKPKLIKIKGKTIADKVRYISSFEEIANTDVEAVFDLILQTAVKNKLPQSELPAKLYLISDMEFDQAVDNASLTNFENAKIKFEERGYKLPDIVFWNVASRNTCQPVTKNDNGAVLVSGCTPRLFSMVASGTMNPFTFMTEVVESERYKPITA